MCSQFAACVRLKRPLGAGTTMRTADDETRIVVACRGEQLRPARAQSDLEWEVVQAVALGPRLQGDGGIVAHCRTVRSTPERQDKIGRAHV